MGQKLDDIPVNIREALREGTVIPAHLLSLNKDLGVDWKRQKALTRYYLDSGVGGLAVGVHTTQFAIRDKGLYEPVLSTAAQTAREWTNKPIVLVAGVTGKTDQAVREAQIAVANGYHFALLNVAAFKGCSEEEILAHCRKIAEEIPLIGFYLLRECGGILLSKEFWRKFAEIENVAAIKMAPFNRYHTLDVIQGVVEAEAEKRITLYTGNDDHIVMDLLAPFCTTRNGERVKIYIEGGLLGHWSVWTKKAVELFQRIKKSRVNPTPEILELDSIVTASNAAIYDAWNDLAGAVPGCHYVLQRQGFFEGTWCLNPNEVLSPGQKEAIDAIYQNYPELNDDAFVQENLEQWMNA